MSVPKKPVIDHYSDMPLASISITDMRWNQTGSWRYIKPRYVRQVAPCDATCPGGHDVEGWLRLIEAGHLVAAWNLQQAEHPFPAVTGRVCYHPCEDRCSRGQFDRAVAINNLERFAADAGAAQATPKIETAPSSGRQVAIVGGGPAGLACACYLARLGHKAVVYDDQPKPGGILRVGIPDYRLPRNVLDREVSAIAQLDVEIKSGVRVGRDIGFDELAEMADAVFLAPGAHKSRRIGVPNDDAPGVVSGLEFLRLVALGEPIDLGRRVVVVGGGNTALDAARTLRRMGAEVTIAYRRSRVEMPAYVEEVNEAEREAVDLRLLAIPSQIVLSEGRVQGLECLQAELGPPDESGRRRPIPIPGSEFVVPADSVVAAIGEICDFDFLPEDMEKKWQRLVINEFGMTSRAGVFAGGDAIDQPRTVIDAIGSAKRAAISIDAWLRGEEPTDALARAALGGRLSMLKYTGTKTPSKHHDTGQVVDHTSVNTDYFGPTERSRMPTLPLSVRFADHGPEAVSSDSPSGGSRFIEVHLGLEQDTAIADVKRCFHCGHCTQCDVCFTFCPDVAIKKVAGGYEIDMDYCKGCGVCVEECPRAAMEMIPEEKTDEG